MPILRGRGSKEDSEDAQGGHPIVDWPCYESREVINVPGIRMWQAKQNVLISSAARPQSPQKLLIADGWGFLT